jgi:hypothetical protein
MSNLIKSTSVFIPKEVSSKSRSVYQANSSVMIKNIEDKNIVVNSIHQAVNRTIADKGVNMQLDEIDYLKKSITDDVIRDFPTLTLQDVVLCFTMGVRGNLGEYFGINVVTLYGWLKKYKEEVIPQAIKEVSLYLPPAKLEEPKIDYKQLDLEKVNNICSAIDFFIKDGSYQFYDFGNIHFNLLNRLGIFDSVSDTEKESTKEDARQLFISDIKKQNLTLLAQGKNFQMTDINSLLEKIEYGEKDTETMIDISYKKLMIKKFIINFKSSSKNKLEKFKNNLLIKIEEYYGK